MHLEHILLTAKVRHTSPHIVWFYSYEMSSIGKSIETERPRAGVKGEERMRMTDTRYEVSLGDDENVLELEMLIAKPEYTKSRRITQFKKNVN